MGVRAFWRWTLLKFLRVAGDPHRVALGFAFGTWISFTPWLGLHLPVSWLLCWIFRGGYLAAWMGTWVGNPWTYALMWWGSLETGRWLLGTNPDASEQIMENLTWAEVWEEFDELFWEVLLPMTVGGLLLGAAVAILFYFVMLWLLKRYREAKARRTLERKLAHEMAKGAGRA